MQNSERLFTLFGIYSCVNNNSFSETRSRIHVVVDNETDAQTKLMEYVHLLTSFENPVFDEKTNFPLLSYKVLENKSVEILEHDKIEKVEKGWVWNGKKSEIQTKKIGLFQVIPVENQFSVAMPVPESSPAPESLPPTEEVPDLISVHSDIDRLINEMVDNSICNMKMEDILDVEETNKKLKCDNNTQTTFDNLFVPFFSEIKENKESDSLSDLSPSPISRLGSRGALRAKRRQPYSSPRRNLF